MEKRRAPNFASYSFMFWCIIFMVIIITRVYTGIHNCQVLLSIPCSLVRCCHLVIKAVFS
ncbi:hypothetical protein GE21DRAFT_1100631 [Neurospora crassa]|nr:hypothetical protein GE21DRAFT_1100631 [Neurospora crassa]